MRTNREGFLVSKTKRECTKCNVLFQIRSNTVTLCPTCNSERVKNNSPEYKMWARAKARSRSKGIEFTIEVKDVVIPQICPILGVQLKCHSGRPGGKKDSPALDRIDPTKGYIKENIQVISHLANMMKSHATPTEMCNFAKWILKTYK